MAEIAVNFLLNQLTLFLRQKAELLGRVRKDAEHIRDELEHMKAFLIVADAKEESVPELRLWIKQLRDVAYDTEDVLDEFILRLGHHHGNGFYGCLRKIACSIKTWRDRSSIASEIQIIKSRMVNISEGHQRYSVMYGSLQEHGSRSTIVSPAWHDRRGDALLLEEAELVGIQKRKRQLIKWLVEGGTKLKSVSVWGMGGLGKTTLVKKVYDDAVVMKHFESHVWLTVSESFRAEDLLKDMIQQLFSEIKQPTPQGVESMDSNKLKGIIKEFLQRRRYVVVFDDVWHINAWEAIKYMLPDNRAGSRVIATTRFNEIASTTFKEMDGHVYELEALSPKESWTLFCKKTFMGNPCPQHLEGISHDILKRCEGLPLAIVAISGVLATKDQSRIDEWEILYHGLGTELEGNDKLQSMKKVISLSYNDLPYYLKICFLYLSIFPEDHEIEWMRVIRLWTAEGFVIAVEGKTIEEVAEGYLNELLNRSLVQVAMTTTDGRPKSVHIHDVTREIILSKSREQNIVTIVRGHGGMRWPEKVRRLSIHSTSENVEYSECFYRLRSLIVLGAVDALPILSSLGGLLRGGSRLLKMLDLRGAPTLETLPDEVFILFHLRYLSLRGTKVKVVPKLIGKLENLETLDLKSTYVTELPIEILRLQKLRHLLLYRYDIKSFYLSFHSVHGFKAPYKVGNMQSLQKISFVEADEIIGNGTSSIVTELGRLTQLRRLGIVKLRREDGVILCSSIEKLSSLRSLSLASTKEDEILDLQFLSLAPRFLQRLYLKGRLEKLPHWIISLHSLVKLRLMWSKLRDDPLQYLQGLPNLVELKLDQAYEGDELCFKAGGFQRLKILYLITLEGLRWVRMDEGTMPRLERLSIRKCELLEKVPSAIKHLTNLKYVEFTDMSNQFISTLDYLKIAHTPIFAVGDTRQGFWQGSYYRHGKLL